jgi:hypothetical protein
MSPEMATTLIDQAVACHERMLELADSDRPSAIQHALNGAKLFALLHQQETTLPDWVPILEEQCCRHGAIWLHELLRESDSILQHPDGHQWVSQALVSMDRLEQLHDSPLDWLAQMRDFLLQLSSPVAAQSKAAQSAPAQSVAVEVQRLVVIGNSQAYSLRPGLASAIPHAEVIFCPWESLTKQDDADRLHQLLANTEALLVQQLPSGYPNPDGIEIAIQGLRFLLPVGARVITVPNLHYEGHHPWIGYIQDADGQLAGLRGASPLGDYHDFLAMAAASRGLEVGDLLQRHAHPGLVEAIGQAHSQSLAELQRQEANCDLGLSDWIAHRYRQAAVMHSIDQPTQATIQQLLLRLLAQLTPTAQASGLKLTNDQALNQHQRPAISIPIHPWVRHSLQLEQWADTWGQKGGQAWPIHEQLASSIAFYRRYPWIGEANLGHPKHRLANHCLDLLTPGAPAATPRAGAPSTAALINYFNDYDMLAAQLDTGCLDPYDRIYIWDGPYSYLLSISLFSSVETRLDQTELGQRLLADPRVVYHYQKWNDEGEKRREAYAAIKEDVVVLHDTDEFFRLDRQQLLRFWKSSCAVGSMLLQNLYAGGLYASNFHYATNQLKNLPQKRVVFKRSVISPANHLDYCWLVGVEQHPTDESLVDQQPFGHAYHLTACRTPKGQAAKMSFYMALATKNQTNHPVADRLQQLAQDGSINLVQAQEIFLRGDPSYGGIPHPDSGLALLPRIIDPCFPETAIKALLAATKRVGPGSYQMLPRYPLYVWIQPQDANLSIKFKQAQTLTLKSWAWCQGQPAQAAEPLSSHTSCLELQLPQLPDLIGHLIELQVENSDTGLCLVDVAITSQPDADAEVNEALPSIPTAPTADTLFDCIWRADRPLASLEAFAERRLPQITTDAQALFEFCDAACYSRNRRHLHLAWEALQQRPADELWTMVYSLRCCLAQEQGTATCVQLARDLLPHAAALDGNNRLAIAAVLAESSPPPGIGTLSALLAAEHQAELKLYQLSQNSRALPFAELLAKHHELLSGLNNLADEDHCPACLTYSACAPSLRRSFHDWASPSAIPRSELEGLLETIRRAVESGQGFSLIRLGESEGIAINSDELGPQLLDAIRNADWVGIPDPSQTLQGPAFTWTVAAHLAKNLSLDDLFKIAPKIHPGGWLINHALLDMGCFASPPFNSVNGLIATMPPATGLQLPAKSLVINSADRANSGTFSQEEHQQVLAWIEASVEPGELFLVNSGTHGPIHCQAIKARGGIAIDVGIALELSSQDIPRQGESRINPQLAARADWAFRAAEALPPITPMLADGRAEEARELMERFLQHQPLAAGGLLRMAEIECHGQQWGRAMDLLSRAHALEPQDSRIGTALAELQLLLRERTPYGLGPDICLTTISTRLHTLEQVVRSLQRQTMPPRRIHIYLSQTPHLLDEGVDPRDTRLQALGEDSTVQLHWVENLGPYRKFALYLQNPANDSDDDRFITVDDDTIYPPRFIEYLAAKHLRHQCVVAHRGRRMRLRPSRGFADYTNWHDGLHEPRLGNLPTGQSGVIYRRAYFPADLQLEAALRIAPTHDDLWLRWLTAAQGVPALITQPNAAAKTAALAFPTAEMSSNYAKSSLWFAFNAPDAANRVNNDQAVKAIHNHFMTLGFDIEKLLRLEEEEQADFY